MKELSAEEQKQYFIHKHGKERGEYLWRIATDAAWAYDEDASQSDALPYYIWVAEMYRKDITKITPKKLQFVVGLTFTTKYDPQTKQIKQLSINEAREEYRKFYKDAFDAIQTQVELTRSYLKKVFPKGVIRLYRATREEPLILKGLGLEMSIEEKRRAIISGTLSKKVAQNFVEQSKKRGEKSRLVEVMVPISKIIDCYLTNIGFVHREYEFRWVK
jgi:hypothetical protein